ncbi:hypothetical protein DLAC_10603 [Tieghemostelium lacteum]|uniref:SHSP domain-containing protein n=1 Tax=Tieghemostelium lacteum TaxID=361077 RepID=A0A151Z4C4_TIELA|nr:hypothetical protein DLAC_10603 [Tieghemostelium lacteum]|eukprot:KYQ88806.1 hypothetical protein DLAC_10603 [Tieghemostelium lacteum]
MTSTEDHDGFLGDSNKFPILLPQNSDDQLLLYMNSNNNHNQSSEDLLSITNAMTNAHNHHNHLSTLPTLNIHNIVQQTPQQQDHLKQEEENIGNTGKDIDSDDHHHQHHMSIGTNNSTTTTGSYLSPTQNPTPMVIVSQPPLPPPLPVHLTLNLQQHIAPALSTQQIIQQQKKLRPITERGQEDKKKEALAFLSFYFKVVTTSKSSTVSRTSILALYSNKTPIDKRYKQPNDMANLCGAVYTFIFQHLDDSTVAEYISSAENERLSSRTDLKKRKRKKNHDISNSVQDINYHDAFLTCIKYASLLPFIEFIGINELQQTKQNDPYTLTHTDWSYTLDDLHKWEHELKDQKTNQSKPRVYSPSLPNLDDDSYNSNNNNNNNNSNNNNLITEKFQSILNNNIYNPNSNNNNNIFSNSSTNTTTTSSPLFNNQNNCNISQNNSFFSHITPISSASNTSLLGASQLINIPVNVTETLENFIIYAFIPFYKPNALKITVNQMDVILEGSISLPDTIQIPNGTEILVPSNINNNCTQCDIQEGNFCKVIKLTHPIASSTVGKRDGVVVIIAKKEEGQTTIHQL